MSTSTLTAGPVRPGGAAGPTPRVELDLPVALNAIHTAGLQVVPDARGGTLIDAGHPAVVPLRPYLPGTGTWAWLTDPAAAGAVHRSMRPVGTVVADARRGPGTGADVVVMTVEQLGTAPEPPRPHATLIDVTSLSPDRPIPPWMLCRPTDVEGFHVDLTGLSPDRLPEQVDAVGAALRSWRSAGRTERAVLVLRGARTVLARHVVGGVLRLCRAGGLAAPVQRIDVTLAVLDVATRTVVRVLGVQNRRGSTVIEVDAVPRTLGAPLLVLGSRAEPAPPVDVMLLHRGRLVSARVSGGPVRGGMELAARGWTPGGRPLVVRGYPAHRAG